jgi:hypothetical protein
MSSQACCKVPFAEDVDHIRKSIEENRGRALQGDIGERVAAEYAHEDLGLHAEFFDPRETGIDLVCRDAMGKLVLIEAKLTEKSGLSSLGTTNHGREGSVEWVEYKATLMCDPSSSFYTPDNAKIGEEILRVGAENVTFLVIHTDPQTFKTDSTKLR